MFYGFFVYTSYPRTQGSFSSLFLQPSWGFSPNSFFPQLFIRALQEFYSLVAFQYGQRNLAISNYSSEVVSFSECQHSLAPVEGIKILSPIVTMECFLQTVILHRRLWGGKNHNETKTKAKYIASLIKYNKPTTSIPKYAGSQYYDEFYCMTNFPRSFIR